MMQTVERATTPLEAISQAERMLLSESDVVWFNEAYQLINRGEYQGGMPTLAEMRKVITIDQFHPLEWLGFGKRALVREYADSIEKAINDGVRKKELRRNRLLYNRLIRWQNYLENPEETPVPRELLSKAKRFHSKYEIINQLVSFARSGEWEPSKPQQVLQIYEPLTQIVATKANPEPEPEPGSILTEKRPNFASRMRQRCLEMVEPLKRLVSPVSRRGLVVAGLATATFFLTTIAPLSLAGRLGINGADPKPDYPYREYVFESEDPLFGDRSSLKGLSEGDYANFNQIRKVPGFNPHDVEHLNILDDTRDKDPWYKKWLSLFHQRTRELNPTNNFDPKNHDLMLHSKKFKIPDGESITASLR